MYHDPQKKHLLQNSIKFHFTPIGAQSIGGDVWTYDLEFDHFCQSNKKKRITRFMPNKMVPCLGRHDFYLEFNCKKVIYAISKFGRRNEKILKFILDLFHDRKEVLHIQNE